MTKIESFTIEKNGYLFRDDFLNRNGVIPQLENWHTSRGYNIWTNDLILILKTSTRPYSCLAKFIICAALV